MLDWLACFAFNWFQRDLCLQLNINMRCSRNSANTLSVELAAKSLFTISPEIKKQIERCAHRKCSETNTHRNKRLDTRPKYPKRCKENYQKNLFRLSFKPDLANCGRLTKTDSTHWRQRFSTTRNVFFFFWSTGRAIHLGWTWAFKLKAKRVVKKQRRPRRRGGRLLGRSVVCKYPGARVMFWRALSRSNEPRDPSTVLIAMTLAMHYARPRTEANCRCDVSFERPLMDFHH